MMNDRKQIFKYVFVTSIIMFLFTVIAPFVIKSLGIEYSPEYETITYEVKEVYEEKNQSIYGTWRTYYVVVEDGAVFKVSSEEYYSSKSTGKFTQKKVKQ